MAHNIINDTQTSKFIVAHNGNEILHAIELEPGQHFSSGQPIVEEFDTIEEARTAFPNEFIDTEE